MTQTPAITTTNTIALASPSALADIASNLRMEPLNPSDLDRLKVPAGGGTSWEVQTLEGPMDMKALRGIVLDSRLGRSYWAEEFGGENNPPDCMSLDGLTGEGNPGGSCDDCPFNQYESAKKGKGKACKETRTVMVLLEGDLLPTVLRIPPSSLKAWRGYMMRVSKSGKRVQHVVTEFTLNKTKSGDGIAYAEIIFNAAGVLTPDQVSAIESYIASVSTTLEAAHASAVVDADPAHDGGSNPFEG